MWVPRINKVAECDSFAAADHVATPWQGTALGGASWASLRRHSVASSPILDVRR